jgi:hypothetical protein
MGNEECRAMVLLTLAGGVYCVWLGVLLTLLWQSVFSKEER